MARPSFVRSKWAIMSPPARPRQGVLRQGGPRPLSGRREPARRVLAVRRLVLVDLLFEFAVFLTIAADLLEHGKPLLGLGRQFHLEIELAEIFIGSDMVGLQTQRLDRKSTRLNSSHMSISYAV